MTAGRVRLWKRGNSGQVLFALALAISLVAHLWALSLLFQSGSRELGSVDVATAAISVNLESTDVIDAAESAASKQAASAPAGAEVDAVKQTQDKTGKIEDSQEQARLAVQANAERQRATEEAEIQEKVKEDAEREETKRRAEEATQPQKLAGAEEVEKKNKDKAKQASMAGGAGATGTEDAQQSQGQVGGGCGARGMIKSTIQQTAQLRNCRRT